MNYKGLMLSVMFASTCMIEPTTKKEIAAQIADLNAEMKQKYEDLENFKTVTMNHLKKSFENKYNESKISIWQYGSYLRNIDMIFDAYMSKITDMVDNKATDEEIRTFINEYAHDSQSFLDLSLCTLRYVMHIKHILDLQVKFFQLVREYRDAE